MKKFLILPALALCLPLMTKPASAEIIVSDDSAASSIAGMISDVGYDSFSLRLPNGETVEVDIDDLSLDEDNFDDYFPEGTWVRVTGEFDDNEFHAEHIIQTPPRPGAEALLSPGFE
jgi:hypothetical protein